MWSPYFSCLSHWGHHLTLITPGPGTTQLRTAPMTQKPTKIIQTSQSKTHLACVPCFTHSFCENTNEVSCPLFPSHSLPLNWPWCFPMCPCMVWHVPSSWKLWATNFLFNSSLLLICLLHPIWKIKPTFPNRWNKYIFLQSLKAVLVGWNYPKIRGQ